MLLTWVWSIQVRRDREWGEWGEEVCGGEGRLGAPGPPWVQDVHIASSGPSCGGGADSGRVLTDQRRACGCCRAGPPSGPGASPRLWPWARAPSTPTLPSRPPLTNTLRSVGV